MSKSTPISQLPFPGAPPQQAPGAPPPGYATTGPIPAMPSSQAMPPQPQQQFQQPPQQGMQQGMPPLQAMPSVPAPQPAMYQMPPPPQPSYGQPAPPPPSSDMGALRDADPTIQEAFTSFVSGGGAPPAPGLQDAVAAGGGYGGVPSYAPQGNGEAYWPGPGVAPPAPEESAESMWSALLPTTPELQLAISVTAAFVLINALPLTDWIARVLPQVIDRVPHGDVVFKALLLGGVVLIAARILMRASGMDGDIAAPPPPGLYAALPMGPPEAPPPQGYVQ